jgi:hypothetical protein
MISYTYIFYLGHMAGFLWSDQGFCNWSISELDECLHDWQDCCHSRHRYTYLHMSFLLQSIHNRVWDNLFLYTYSLYTTSPFLSSFILLLESSLCVRVICVVLGSGGGWFHDDQGLSTFKRDQVFGIGKVSNLHHSVWVVSWGGLQLSLFRGICRVSVNKT